MHSPRPALEKIPFLIISLLVLAACGGGGGSSSDSTSTVAAASRSQNPFLPTTASVVWRFNGGTTAEFNGTRSVAGATVDILEYSSGGREYYVTTDDAIFVRGIFSPRIIVSGQGTFTADSDFGENLLLWKRGMLPGAFRSFDTTGVTTVSPTFGAQTLNVRGTASYRGPESIDVPGYGPVEAERVEYDLTLTAVISGRTFVIRADIGLWFAEGLGIVRRTEGSAVFTLAAIDGNDRDGDGVFDEVDFDPDDPSLRFDHDDDGIADALDPDDDNDGIPDVSDPFPRAVSTPEDTDGDGIPDTDDEDDDDDGRPDTVDAYPLDPTRFQLLTLLPRSLDFDRLLGSPFSPPFQEIETEGGSVTWSTQTTASWLSVVPATGRGGVDARVSVDGTGLGSGVHSAQVIFRDETNRRDIPVDVTFTVTQPGLVLSKSALVLDGRLGWDQAADTLDYSLSPSTDPTAHPIRAELRTASADAIEIVTIAPARSTPAPLDIRVADPSLLQLLNGSEQGEVEVTVTIEGEEIAQTVSLELLAPAIRIDASRTAIGFTAVAGGSRVVENVAILESEGRAGIPVRVQSNADWLRVDREFTLTGSTVELRAEPLLAPNQATSFAEVEITGIDPSVGNTVTIKVALYRDSVIPNPPFPTTLPLDGDIDNSRAFFDAYRPYLYLYRTDGSGIEVYNAHTLAFLERIPLPTPNLAEFGFSRDGRYLFATVSGSLDVQYIDLEDPTRPLASWSLPDNPFGDDGSGDFALVEADGRLLYISELGEAFDALTGTFLGGELLPPRTSGNVRAVDSGNGRHACVAVDLFSSNQAEITCGRYRSATNPDRVIVERYPSQRLSAIVTRLEFDRRGQTVYARSRNLIYPYALDSTFARGEAISTGAAGNISGFDLDADDRFHVVSDGGGTETYSILAPGFFLPAYSEGPFDGLQRGFSLDTSADGKIAVFETAFPAQIFLVRYYFE